MPDSNLFPRLQRLREIAPKLNETTDATNVAIRGVEEFLKSLGLGIAAEVPIDSDLKAYVDPDEGCTVQYRDCDVLAFERYEQQGAFRVVLKRVVLHDFGEAESKDVKKVTPLAECSRQNKLRAMAFIPALLEKIAARAEEIDSDAAKAAKGVQTVLASLSPSFLMPPLSEVLRGVSSGAPPLAPQEAASLLTPTAAYEPVIEAIVAAPTPRGATVPRNKK